MNLWANSIIQLSPLLDFRTFKVNLQIFLFSVTYMLLQRWKVILNKANVSYNEVIACTCDPCYLTFFSTFGSIWCQRERIFLTWSSQTHSSSCEHRSPAPTFCQAFCFSGTANQKKAGLKEGRRKLKSIVSDIKWTDGLQRNQEKPNKDYSKLWTM